MEKLELKHLSPYLPYGLMVMTKWRKDGKFNKPKILRGQDLDVLKNSKNLHIKPLLHPLERITDEFKSKYYFYYDNHGGFQLKAKNELYTRLDDLQYLFKNHFDVFGLIEKGLAEPIKLDQ